MAPVNYCNMDLDPCQDVHKPIPFSRKSAFRKSYWLSIGRSESSSLPGAIPVESDTLSDDFRDEVSSSKSDEKNNNRALHLRSDSHKSDDTSDPFEFNPSWNVDDKSLRNTGEEKREQPEVSDGDKDSEFSPSVTTKKINDRSQLKSNRSILLIRPGVLKFDQLSKVLVRKKNPYKYKSFLNEKRTPRRPEATLEAKGVAPSLETALAAEGRNETGRMNCRPEDFASFFQPLQINDLSHLGSRHTDSDTFHPNLRDEDQCKEETSIGPLQPNTTLRLVVQESPTALTPSPTFGEKDQPPCDDSPSVLKEKGNNASIKMATTGDKQRDYKHNETSKTEGQKDKTKGTPTDDNSDCPSDGDYSSVITGNTENLPLLRSWGMDIVDCNNCGSKSKKKLEAKKKRAEAKKKFIDDLWERGQFYWKYESVGDKQKEALEELDNLVFKLAPEPDNTPEDGFIQMPIGIQLSTITEGDEEFTACYSPRSTNMSVSLGAGFLQDGKVTLNAPVGSLLDNTGIEAAESCSEDELEGIKIIDSNPPKAHPQDPNTESAPGSSEAKSSMSEGPKVYRRSRWKGGLTVNEIVIPTAFSDASTDASKGEISDITEDYLHIPVSSPLYAKVMKAFRDAKKLNGGRSNEKAEMNYLRSVVL